MSRYEQLSLKYILASILTLLPLTASAQVDIPKLMVCIAADQFDPAVWNQVKSYLGKDGLARLESQGVVFQNVEYPFSPINGAAAVATLNTGTTPNRHGISAEDIYDPNTNEISSIVEDGGFTGKYTRKGYSPKNLLCSTLADQLKTATNGAAVVYSVAPNASQAISSAGFSANGAYWLDDLIASWATSSYYPDMPSFVSNYNQSKAGPNQSLSDKKWTPSMSYRQTPYTQGSRDFKYFYGSTKVSGYKRSGLVNEEVTTLAKLLIANGAYTTNHPGLLMLTYYCGRSVLDKQYGLSAEVIDTYVRLDRQLASLFSLLDSKIGTGKYIVSFTGTGYALEPQLTKHDKRLVRVFSTKKCKTLVNLYLKAIYGGSDLVLRCSKDGLYLNRKRIEQNKLDIAQIEHKVAEILNQMEGVDFTLTSSDIQKGVSFGEEKELKRRAINKRFAPDVSLSLLPDWEVQDEELAGKVSDSYLYDSGAQYVSVRTPFIIMGGGIVSKRIATPIRATQVAPTLCGILKIRPPNGCTDIAVDIVK